MRCLTRSMELVHQPFEGALTGVQLYLRFRWHLLLMVPSSKIRTNVPQARPLVRVTLCASKLMPHFVGKLRLESISFIWVRNARIVARSFFDRGGYTESG